MRCNTMQCNAMGVMKIPYLNLGGGVLSIAAAVVQVVVVVVEVVVVVVVVVVKGNTSYLPELVKYK